MTKTEEAITRGKKILGLRKSKGISRRGLAKNIDISDTALANIENGETKNITIELGKGIAIALNISFNELFDIETTVNKEIEKLNNEKEQFLKIIKDQEKIIGIYDRQVELYDSFQKTYKADAKSAQSIIINLLLKYEELLKKSKYFEKDILEKISTGMRKEAIQLLQQKHSILIDPEYFEETYQARKFIPGVNPEDLGF